MLTGFMPPHTSSGGLSLMSSPPWHPTACTRAFALTVVGATEVEA